MNLREVAVIVGHFRGDVSDIGHFRGQSEVAGSWGLGPVCFCFTGFRRRAEIVVSLWAQDEEKREWSVRGSEGHGGVVGGVG